MSDKRLGRTKPVQSEGPVPRMPHERDESSDSQLNEEPPELMRRAHDDVDAGRVDTDRGPPMNDTYQRQKETPLPAGKTRRKT
ncbi:MAG: hypothetical protein KF891_08360 [Rhizobacter sp.]|nr:hypothetical protein [Rhizobacter sp.]